MAELRLVRCKLISLVGDRIFSPPVAVIEDTVIKPAEVRTKRCDCGNLAINLLLNPLRGKIKYTCESLQCVEAGIKMLKD